MDTIEKALSGMGPGKGRGDNKGGRGSDSGSGGGTGDVDCRLDFQRLRQAGMITPEDGRTQIVEEYRRIKRPLLKNVYGGDAVPVAHSNLIGVTSSLPGEGKTFTAINLAMSIAMELDRTVLLVDADITRSSVISYLDISPRPGLVDYLEGASSDLSSLMLKTNVPTLTILPAGSFHPNATELLGSHAMRDLTAELSKRYHDRVVIFDCPPLLVTSEAPILCGLMGQVVFVVESLSTHQSEVQEALSLMDENQTVGLVINKKRGKSKAAYYGKYGMY